MKRIERKLMDSIKAQIQTGRPSYFIQALIEGMGIEVVDGFAFVGNLEIDLRFENLTPEIRVLK